jgi:hypothetical protein
LLPSVDLFCLALPWWLCNSARGKEIPAINYIRS